MLPDHALFQELASARGALDRWIALLGTLDGDASQTPAAPGESTSHP